MSVDGNGEENEAAVAMSEGWFYTSTWIIRLPGLHQRRSQLLTRKRPGRWGSFPLTWSSLGLAQGTDLAMEMWSADGSVGDKRVWQTCRQARVEERVLLISKGSSYLNTAVDRYCRARCCLRRGGVSNFFGALMFKFPRCCNAESTMYDNMESPIYTEAAGEVGMGLVGLFEVTRFHWLWTPLSPHE